jgi:hypothetical protein
MLALHTVLWRTFDLKVFNRTCTSHTQKSKRQQNQAKLEHMHKIQVAEQDVNGYKIVSNRESLESNRLGKDRQYKKTSKELRTHILKTKN